ncbi:LANO_0G01838g1_1 [Lachancea nothofagi CBS 11611]|uniref:LANO_0G01838g1_1 n=1 Tax=Lachancea nothofagi CBS 11611 TaxID=1266666 RepID=A0A1G4KF03_9SACH|nr:LANO_0G01838g1_1 [Lachancea nothofagi CBS 11611]
MKLGQLSPTKGLLAPPKTFQNGDDKNSRSRSSSFSRIFSSSDSSPRRKAPPLEEISTAAIPPELVPIVTLLSAQAHRRYHEGVFLVLKDLNSDGSPAARTWKEVYGVLIGTQLALWDARVLAENGDKPDELMKATSKPTYINFTDASFRPLDPKEAVIADGKKQLQNTVVVSTTLKNRYFLQFSDKEAFANWHASFRLSAFEFTALQEAYTGAFLSTKGAKLGDIRVILAETKFDYEDWVSVRFGAGMPWKRCYAVISQPTKKSKNKRICGEINFFENEKKTKKVQAMTTVSDASAVYALYPSSPVLIDTSTMIKLEGQISFGKKDTPKPTDIFIMPEKHHAVPGYDTIIRFLIPTMNAFQLYGRPKRLIADRHDLNSLLFALPTLPHVHFLQKEDVMPLAASSSNMTWSVIEWRDRIKSILSKKVNSGYTGCGSSEGLDGALASPAIGSNELFDSTPLQTSPLLASVSRFPSETKPSKAGLRSASSNSRGTNLLHGVSHAEESLASEKIDSSYSYRVADNEPTGFIASPAELGETKTAKPIIEIQHSNFDGLERTAKPSAGDASASRKSELSTIYDKYSQVPFGTSEHELPHLNIDKEYRNSVGAYEDYMGSPKVRNLDISNLRDSNSTDQTDFSRALHVPGEVGGRSNTNSFHSDTRDSHETGSVKDDVLEDFYSLSQQISQMGLENKGPSGVDSSQKEIADDFNFENLGNGSSSLDNVFDPDYLEQNQMLDDESHYTNNESKFQYGSDNLSQQSFTGARVETARGPANFDSHSRVGQTAGIEQSQMLPKQRSGNKVVTPTSQKFYHQNQLNVNGPNGGSAERLMNMKHSPVYANLNAAGANEDSGSPLRSKQSGSSAPASTGQNRRPVPRGTPMGMPQQPPVSRQMPMPQQVPMSQQMPMPQQVPMSQQMPIPQQVPMPQQMGYGPRVYSPVQPGGMANAYNRPGPSNSGPAPPGAHIMYQRGPAYGSVPPPNMKNSRPAVQHPPPVNPVKQKPRTAMTGGFSQFMPATANNPNPYSANPYQQ